MPDNEIQTGNAVQALYFNNHYKARHGYAVDSGVAPSVDTGQLGQSDTLEVTSGTIWFDQRPIDVDGQNIGIDSSDSNPRKDVGYVDGSGNIEVITGTPAPVPNDQQGAARFTTYNPSPADLSDRNAVPIFELWVPGGASEVQEADVNDIRAFESRLMVLDSFDITATTGTDPAVDTVLEDVTDDETQAFDILLVPNGTTGVDTYAWNFDWGRSWGDDSVDVDLTVTWDDDPEQNIDLTAYAIQVNL